jgi:transposase
LLVFDTSYFSLPQINTHLNADKKRIAELETKVAQLEAIIMQLLEKIEILTHSKNSRNSSVPPSKDENRPLKNQSLRTKSDKKVGGQNGHQGTTLKMVDTPDITILHEPNFCKNCGGDLKFEPSEFVSKRQIIDIPPIKPEYTEHQIFKKVCLCGFCNVADFPSEVGSSISYGSGIQATIAYLHTRQYLPFERMSEFFQDFCNLPISQGTICNLLEKFAQKAQPAYDLIANKIENEKVVGSDETGIKINGQKGWFWTWQNKCITYIAFSNNRGFASIEANFIKGFQKAVLVHDCWSSHFKTDCKTHQLCSAHLIRELIFFEERYQSKWATDFKTLLYKALEVKKNLTYKDYKKPIKIRTEILLNLKLLLQTPIDKQQKDLCAFHKRMTKYENYIFTFLFYQYVPPDNNGSERAIRNVKVKQKISGQFKTERGATIYAVIRSVTDTCIKNGQNILFAFKTIAKLQAE